LISIQNIFRKIWIVWSIDKKWQGNVYCDLDSNFSHWDIFEPILLQCMHTYKCMKYLNGRIVYKLIQIPYFHWLSWSQWLCELPKQVTWALSEPTLCLCRSVNRKSAWSSCEEVEQQSDDTRMTMKLVWSQFAKLDVFILQN